MLMKESVLSRVADARGFFTKLWKLCAPYWWSEERWFARGILALILLLNVGIVYILTLLNDWNARFFNALQDKNEAAFWSELKYWVVIVAIYIVVAVYRLWLRQLLSIRWRRWLTKVYVADWLGDRTYYRMELAGPRTDNPEQRIEQDIRLLTENTLIFAVTLISEVMTLGTFAVILWNLSGAYVLPIFGGLQIPGYMMWAALLYAVVGTWITYLIGRPLIRINFNLERFNADFRFRMSRIRENAESIALYKGEVDEQRRLGGAFGNIYDTWWAYMKHTKRLVGLTAFYSQAASIFPIIVASPRYFAGEVPLGVLTQTANAFGQVQSSLSWIVDNFRELAEWRATVDRLTSFGEAIEQAKVAQLTEHGFKVADNEAAALVLNDVEVALPNGRVLLDDVDVVVEPGQRVVIQGPSGSGKTTLFRVLAGLWPFGRGEVRLPKGAKALFLPQKPYIPIGTLKEALCYPDKPDAHSDAEVGEVLTLCELGHLADRLHDTGNWSMVLSPGEQQRLSFARALLVRPDWLFLDEASSALDEATETAMYGLLVERLPDATLVSIAHKPSVLRFHDRRLVLDPSTRSVRGQTLAPAQA
jgi:putative ATP-binding cassette transporter